MDREPRDIIPGIIEPTWTHRGGELNQIDTHLQNSVTSRY